MANEWIITRDYVDKRFDDGDPRTASRDWKPSTRLPIRFRLYDDDGNLYYEGRMEQPDFEPLDDFGLGYAGATELRYYEHGQWKTL